MKKIKLFFSVIMILTLLAVSAVGMFALPVNNIDDRKVSVAVVNEDIGAAVNGREKNYGTDFTKLFTKKIDGKYEVTTRSAALDGLNNGKYDLAIIVPNTFTQKAITYDSKEPETAFLEYIKSPSLTQVESLKSDVVAKVLKETANKALVETFTFEILKTMQDMQGKSLNIIENETVYQKNFKENVESPVTDSMEIFNKLLDELSSEQSALGHFDTSVKTFDTSVVSQSDSEKQHLENFENLKARYNSTSKLLSEWSNDYNSTVKMMNDDTFLKSLIDIQTLGAMNLQTMIDNMKFNTVKLELQIQAMEDYKTKMINLKNAYSEIAGSGVIKQSDTKDGVNDENDEKVNNLKQTMDELMGNEAIVKTISDVTNSQKIGPSYTKMKFEQSFQNACSVFPQNLQSIPAGYDINRFNRVKTFCDQGNMPMNPVNIGVINAVYEKEASDFFSGLAESLDTTKISNFISGKYKRYETITGKLIAEGAVEKGITKFGGKATLDTTINVSMVYKETKMLVDGVKSEIPYNPADNKYEGVLHYHGGLNDSIKKEFTNLTPKVLDDEMKNTIDTQQKEAIASIQQIEALIQVYYGKTLEQLLNDYNTDKSKVSPLPSDQNITGSSNGIQKFRPYAEMTPITTIVNSKQEHISSEWDGSLIARIEKVFDEEVLKSEITKSFATTLSDNTDSIISEINQCIDVLKTHTNGALDKSKLPNTSIYTDETHVTLIEPKIDYYLDREVSEVQVNSYNEAVANMTTQHDELAKMSQNLSAFDTKFKIWLEEYNNLSEGTLETSKLHESEGEIVIQLNDNQKQILTGISDLKKQIDSQLEESKKIIESSDKLKQESDTSKIKIEEHTVKLQETKKKFDDTVKDNDKFVSNFIQKYISALNGGADNQLFYQNMSNPVELSVNETQSTNSLVAFFIIILITIFSLIIAYFYSQWNISKISTSEHEEISIFSGIATQIGLVVLTAISVAIIIGYIGMSEIGTQDVTLIQWFVLLSGISIACTMTFYMLLLRFKTFGMLSIGIMMMMYFITNGALGLNIMKNGTLTWLQWINPLVYFEKPLQSVISKQEMNLLPVLTILLLVTISSIVIIYIFQPLVHRQEMKKYQ